MLKFIEKLGSSHLSVASNPVLDFEDIAFKDAAWKLLRLSPQIACYGIAAPQIGVHMNMFSFGVDGRFEIFVNAKITEVSDETIVAEEGCLSIPGVFFAIERPAKLNVWAQDMKGNVFEREVDDLPARIISHEVDHNYGKLVLDRLDPKYRDEFWSVYHGPGAKRNPRRVS